MKPFPKIEFDDEFKRALHESLNKRTLFMNPRTGTVQRLAFWQTEKEKEYPEAFVESELFQVKLVDDRWVRVN